MPKFPKPWFRKNCGWYVTLDGQQIPLGMEREAAFEQYHDLMRQPRERKVPTVAVVSIIDQFLEWVQKNRAAETYVWYQSGLQLFAAKYPDLLTKDLNPIHVQQWIDGYACLSSGTRRNYPKAIVRCMTWAEEQGLIERSPIARFKKPKAGVRQTVITPEDYAGIHNFIPNESFRELLIFAWETGARAKECLAIEKRHVDLSMHRIVFPIDEEKMQRAPRVIYLTEAAEEIVRRLVLQHPSGPILRNTNGAAWSTEAVNCAFVALQIRIGLRAMKEGGCTLSEEEIERKIATLKTDRKARRRVVQKTADELREEARKKLSNAAACSRAKKLCLTVFRHSFCHRLLKSGVDALTVSVLMGHADPSMIARSTPISPRHRSTSGMLFGKRQDEDCAGLDRNVLEARAWASGSWQRHRPLLLLGPFQERRQLLFADPDSGAAVMAEFARFHQAINSGDRAVQAFSDLRDSEKTSILPVPRGQTRRILNRHCKDRQQRETVVL